jgi:hypothetical protein
VLLKWEVTGERAEQGRRRRKNSQSWGWPASWWGSGWKVWNIPCQTVSSARSIRAMSLPWDFHNTSQSSRQAKTQRDGMWTWLLTSPSSVKFLNKVGLLRNAGMNQ